MAFLISPRLRAPLVQCAAVLVGLSAQGTPTHAQTPNDLEYRVKSAYLLNFTRYVEWPASAFAGPDAPLTICVLGRDPFGGVLDETIRNRRTSGRPLQVLRRDRP
jgi:hypothetical protein